MIRHIHIHRVLIQAEKEGFLEEAVFELHFAGWGEGAVYEGWGRHSWLMVHNKQKRDPGCMKMSVREEAGGGRTEAELSSEVRGQLWMAGCSAGPDGITLASV